MSGHSAEAMRLAEAAGPEFTLLQKPYTVAELAQAVRAALDGAA